MNPSFVSTSIEPSPRTGFKKIAPALVLFFLSPFVAEFLLGNISISALGALVFLAPMYGGGAVVIREIARRFNRGWPTIILLALAYGLLEEGIFIQTLFNPHYMGFSLLTEAYMPSLGMGGWWTLFVLTLHTVWSISVPIAITEGLFPKRWETPWLGKMGLTVFVILYIIGDLMIRGGTSHQDHFTAMPTQLISVAIAVLVIVVIAFQLKKGSPMVSGSVPKPILVGGFTFLVGLAFMSAHAVLHAWIIVSVYCAIYVVGFGLLSFWSHRESWSPLHTLAAGGGAMLTYACTAFPQVPVIGAKGTVDLIGNSIFAVVAVWLLIAATKRQRHALAASAIG